MEAEATKPLEEALAQKGARAESESESEVEAEADVEAASLADLPSKHITHFILFCIIFRWADQQATALLTSF